MKLEDAFRRSIRQFLKGETPRALIEASEGAPKYSLEYFDELEAELMEQKEAEDNSNGK